MDMALWSQGFDVKGEGFSFQFSVFSYPGKLKAKIQHATLKTEN
jgi:hypothetical protein